MHPSIPKENTPVKDVVIGIDHSLIRTSSQLGIVVALKQKSGTLDFIAFHLAERKDVTKNGKTLCLEKLIQCLTSAKICDFSNSSITVITESNM